MKTLQTKSFNSIHLNSKQRLPYNKSIAVLKNTVYAISASSIVSMPALAEEAINPNIPVTTLPAITVTATRTPTPISNTIAQTRVIDSADLKRFQGQTVLEVIKHLPGVSSFSNGGMGSNSNFYLRGYDNKSILVLVDGIRYSSISSGGAALGLLPADQIERIEVLYGASGSSLYGADAMGGVIQIFSKGAEVLQSQFSVTGGAGSNDHYLYGATAQFRNDQGSSISLSANHNETDGINAISNPTNFSFNPDQDGFESNNYSLHLKHQLNPELTLGISGLYSDSTSEFDSGSSAGKDMTESNQKNGAAQAYVDWNYALGSQAKLFYGRSIDESKTTATTYTSEYNTEQDQISLVGNHALPLGQVVYGAEHLKQTLDSDAYNADDRKVNSGFMGYVLSHNEVDAQFNVRYDRYSDFDNETTYNLGGAYHFSPNLRGGINYAKGYRVPTFNDLYYPGSENPDLTPETSDNYEAFIEFTTPQQSTRLTGYRNNVDDILTYVSTFNDQGEWLGGAVQNINKAKIKGITLTSDWRVDDYLFGLSYDYQDAKDDSGQANDGDYLPIRPEHKGLIYLGYQFENLDIRTEYQHVDDYYYSVGNQNKVDSYDLVNISGNYQLNPNLSLSTRINNIFNENYVTAPGYNTDGTNFFTSLTYTWQ